MSFQNFINKIGKSHLIYAQVRKDGKIIESGTHEELMSKGGKYQYLYSLQFRE